MRHEFIVAIETDNMPSFVSQQILGINKNNELIRCRECKFYKETTTREWCARNSHWTDGEGFCSWAKKENL